MDEHTKPTDDGVAIDNLTRRGEDIGKNEKEAGREDAGTQGETERPMGTSTARDYTGVDPQEPQGGGSPVG